jgi:two-component system, chemotaxis family, response regulator Rcp1
MKSRPRILLVEDNEGDIVLTLKAMAKVDMQEHVDVVRDGAKALEFLKKEGPYHEAETPGLILLDINLPRLNGKEVLATIKNYGDLRMIPVIMLTTSNAQSDIRQSYYYHANCFITKPADFGDFMKVIESIKEFWMKIACLPHINENEEIN